jgi:hypothetical protein
MADYLLTIEDREKRLDLSKAVISVMQRLIPQNKESIEARQKMWDYLYKITDYRLDVEGPFPKPVPASKEEHPEPMPYPVNGIKYRHYGRIVSDMVEKIAQHEDGDIKNLLTEQLANQMKRSYVNWNADSVNDDVISSDLLSISAGQAETGRRCPACQCSTYGKCRIRET